MKEKALRTKIDELVATLQQRIDIVTATAVSQFEQETENNYAKLDYLKAHFKKDDSINDWLNDKQEFTEKLDKLESIRREKIVNNKEERRSNDNFQWRKVFMRLLH